MCRSKKISFGQKNHRAVDEMRKRNFVVGPDDAPEDVEQDSCACTWLSSLGPAFASACILVICRNFDPINDRNPVRVRGLLSATATEPWTPISSFLLASAETSTVSRIVTA